MDTITVAAFTGNQDTGFPNTHTVRNVARHDPDVLFFSGDQIYESVVGYGIERAPVETAALDYLRKWYLLGWAFGDLMRDRVTVSMPDDHDVYQGNIWGGGGRKVTIATHATGGYAMPAEWVDMVQRTQTSHLPDPYDPLPIRQDIGVYFTELNYGRVSFGIIEDRKFKSGPEGLVPPSGGRPDHVTDPNFDPAAYDVPGATLLGERQLAFIRDWTSDWRGADMKVSLTQTIFANAATTHGANKMRLVADLDSNGWPQSARNRALRELRKGFTFMIGGADTALARATPILEAMGETIVHAGGPGNGQAAKICNNLILGATMIAVGEAFVLGEKLGLTHQKLFDIAAAASGQCWSLTSYCPVPGPVPASPANRDYAPGFTAAMMLKDLRLAQEAAQAADAATPLGAQAAALYALFTAAGHGGKDFSGIITMLRGDG